MTALEHAILERKVAALEQAVRSLSEPATDTIQPFVIPKENQ